MDTKVLMASDLGWGVGQWPSFFDYQSQTYWLDRVEREAHDPVAGDIVSVRYRCGHDFIRVYND